MKKKRTSLKDLGKEIGLFNTRLLSAAIIVAVLSVALLLRLSYLQIMQHSMYTTLSTKNQVTLLPIAPNRGLIYDRNGVLIAQNIPVFSLEVTPDKVANLKQTIANLQNIIQITPDDLNDFYKQVKQHRRFETVPLKIKLTDEEVARFYVNEYRFPGVQIKAQLIRYYPLGPSFADVIGYVGRINQKELNEIDQTNYAATNFIGKLGIEAQYEKQLHGKVGYQQVETDATGRTVRVLKRIPPTPGDNLYLSVDSQLQIAAESALGDNNGAVIVIQPNTGEILAMVSKPTYDPNVFVQGMSSQEFNDLENAQGHPLFNRALRGQYPFGSTIKPFVALEALASGTITQNYSIYDPGHFSLPNTTHVYRDWKKYGHGTVDVTKAIAMSCDTFFYTVGVKMGIDDIDTILADFGFGKPTGVDIGEELPGLVPSPTWKRKVHHQAWYTGDTVISAIGQGFMLATPLQLANGVSILAMRGHGYQPHFLTKWEDAAGQLHDNPAQELPAVNVPEQDWDIVINGMHDVTLPGGTGYVYFERTPYTVAGKSGTAQVYSTQGRGEEKNLPKELRDNSLFIAFAPVDNPQVAIAVMAEHSEDAKRVARKVLDAYFKEQAQVQAQAQTPAPTTIQSQDKTT